MLILQSRAYVGLVSKLDGCFLGDARLLLKLGVKFCRLRLELKLHHPGDVVRADGELAAAPNLRRLRSELLTPNHRLLLLLPRRATREVSHRVALLLGRLEFSLQPLKMRAKFLPLRRLPRGRSPRLELVLHPRELRRHACVFLLQRVHFHHQRRGRRAIQRRRRSRGIRRVANKLGKRRRRPTRRFVAASRVCAYRAPLSRPAEETPREEAFDSPPRGVIRGESPSTRFLARQSPPRRRARDAGPRELLVRKVKLAPRRDEVESVRGSARNLPVSRGDAQRPHRGGGRAASGAPQRYPRRHLPGVAGHQRGHLRVRARRTFLRVRARRIFPRASHGRVRRGRRVRGGFPLARRVPLRYLRETARRRSEPRGGGDV